MKTEGNDDLSVSPSPKSWEEQERTTFASVPTPQPAARTADRVATTEDEDGLVDVVGRLLE